MFSLFWSGKKAGMVDAFTIAPLRASASAQCARLHAPAFAHPWSAADFEAILTAPANIADGATISTATSLAGFVVSSLAVDEAEILTVAVDSGLRRQGIGRKLLLTHMGRLAGMGAKRLFLEVDDKNLAALGLYQMLGFSQVGTRLAYYRKADGSRGAALVLMRELG